MSEEKLRLFEVLREDEYIKIKMSDLKNGDSIRWKNESGDEYRYGTSLSRMFKNDDGNNCIKYNSDEEK